VNKLQYIVKSVNVLNCLLAFALAAAGYYIIVPYLNLKIQTALPAVGKAATEWAIPPSSLPAPSFYDYAPVSEQNLFHPQRRIPPEKMEEKASTAVAVPKPDLILYGTLIGDNFSIAYVEDKKAPFSTPGRGQRQRQLKKGDMVGGYVLREIEPNQIVLAKGEEKLVVMLDQKDKKRSGETAAAPGGIPQRSGAPAAARGATGTPGAGGSPQRSSTPAISGSAATALPGAGGLSVPLQATSQGTTTPTTPSATPATTVTPSASPASTPPGTALTPGYTPTQRGGPYYTRPGARPYDIRPVPKPKP